MESRTRRAGTGTPPSRSGRSDLAGWGREESRPRLTTEPPFMFFPAEKDVVPAFFEAKT